MLDDLLLGGPDFLAHDHHGLEALAVNFVRNADNRTFRYGRVSVDHLFDLNRIDIRFRLGSPCPAFGRRYRDSPPSRAFRKSPVWHPAVAKSFGSGLWVSSS